MDSEVIISLITVLLLVLPSIYISKAICSIVLTFMDPVHKTTPYKESKTKVHKI
jgi:hypothetical protein